MRAIHVLTIAATVLALAGSAAADTPALPPAVGLAHDVVLGAPGFADAAVGYALERAQPYEATALAQVDAAFAPVHDAYVQVSDEVCLGCRATDALALAPPAIGAAADLSAQGDAALLLALDHGLAAYDGLRQGQVPDAAWACPALQAAWPADAPRSDAGALTGAAATFAGHELPALPAPADDAQGATLAAVRDAPATPGPAFPLAC